MIYAKFFCGSKKPMHEGPVSHVPRQDEVVTFPYKAQEGDFYRVNNVVWRYPQEQGTAPEVQIYMSII